MKYFLRSKEWKEVTKEEYIAAERSQGFHGPEGEPATSAFSGKTMQGYQEYESGDHDNHIREVGETEVRET